MENLKLDADSIQIEEELKQIQNKICSFLIQTTSQHYIEVNNYYFKKLILKTKKKKGYLEV